MLRRRTLSVFFFVIFGAIPAFAQFPNGISARILFPPRNFEMPIGDTIIPRARIINTSSHVDSGIIARYIIRNVVTNIAVYSRLDSIPILAFGDSADITFVPYGTSPNTIAELGTFRGCLLVIDSGRIDTTCGLIFSIRRTSVPFFDPSDNYGKTLQGDIPDQTMWCSIGATVVDGEDSTWDPPPPRNIGYSYNPDSLNSPVMRLDRKDFDGKFYTGTGVGDTLTSFPINLQAKTQIIFSFDYMRGGKYGYPLGWDNPESSAPLESIVDGNGNIFRGDSLIVEFRKPTAPVFNPLDTDWNEIAAIDGGHDFEFKTIRISRNYDSLGYPQPVWNIQLDGKTILFPDTTDYFTPDFRFRLRLKANNSASSYPVENAAPWYVDNVRITNPLLPEGELSWIKVVTPYTKVPRSQAVFPVCLRFFNRSYPIDFSQPLNAFIIGPDGDTVYSDTIEINNVAEGQDTTIRFKDWDARNIISGKGSAYTAIASSGNAGWFDSPNDVLSTFSIFYLSIDTSTNAIQGFAMGAGNDIPALTGVNGEGIGFSGTTGSLAMKFTLANPDTLYGIQALFGDANPESDFIQVELLGDDSATSLPGSPVSPNLSQVMFERGPILNQFDTIFTGFIPLSPGTYWIGVSQINTSDMELGGNTFHGGAQVIHESKMAPVIRAMYNDPLGTEWGSNAEENNGKVVGMFAYETPAGSGNWKSMTPDSGWWPAMDSSSHLTPIIVPNTDSIRWTGLGTYFPDIRPMFAPYSPPSSVQWRNNAPNLTLSVYPNPFNLNSHSMRISFFDGSEEPATIVIRNVLGNLVKRIALLPDQHSILWDGKYENGETIPAGIYFMELTAGAEHAIEKIIVQ